jgi:glutamate N-acetyltransferase/amino-acid N-acetyltransferase
MFKLPRVTAPPTFPPAPLTLTSVAGLRAAGVRAGIKASGSPDVALLVADAPMSVAGVFTQNLLAAAPVIVSREHLAKNGGRARAIVVNSGNANACTGAEGERNARAMCAQTAKLVGCAIEEVLVCSTGVIGHALPMEKIESGIARAFMELAHDVEAGRRFLAAIMTTDAFPKEACASHDVEGKSATFAGVCKGAGMIHPNMATMLAFVASDLAVAPSDLVALAPRVAAHSFNAVHVDTHPSTNDTFFLIATGQGASKPGAFEAGSREVAERLAWLIARDGEGATKVTTIEVTGATSDAAAHSIANLVASSALVRTALYGNDPNWGRFTSQVGNSTEVRDIRALCCTLQGIKVFEAGEPARFDREEASRAMATDDVRLLLELKDGPGRAKVMTSDLGYRYIEVNAEYTT